MRRLAIALLLLGCGSADDATTVADLALEGQSDLVTPGGRWTCVPRDLDAEDWYGCWVQPDAREPGKFYCVTPPDRMRTLPDGSLVLQTDAQCAGKASVDGRDVPSNLIIWGAELHLSGDALKRVPVGPPEQATWRFLDREADAWRTLESDEFLAGSRLSIERFEPAVGGTIAVGVDVAFCGGTVFSHLDSPPPHACCMSAKPGNLRWTVGEHGALLPQPDDDWLQWGRSSCCGPADRVDECIRSTAGNWHAPEL
jgi:hypothetical protein